MCPLAVAIDQFTTAEIAAACTVDEAIPDPAISRRAAIAAQGVWADGFACRDRNPGHRWFWRNWGQTETLKFCATAAGEPATKVDFSARSTGWTYDTTGRVATIDYPRDPEVTFTYPEQNQYRH